MQGHSRPQPHLCLALRSSLPRSLSLESGLFRLSRCSSSRSRLRLLGTLRRVPPSAASTLHAIGWWSGQAGLSPARLLRPGIAVWPLKAAHLLGCPTSALHQQQSCAKAQSPHLSAQEAMHVQDAPRPEGDLLQQGQQVWRTRLESGLASLCRLEDSGELGPSLAALALALRGGDSSALRLALHTAGSVSAGCTTLQMSERACTGAVSCRLAAAHFRGGSTLRLDLVMLRQQLRSCALQPCCPVQIALTWSHVEQQ